MISFIFVDNNYLQILYSDKIHKDYPNILIIKLNNVYIKIFTKSSDITVKQIGVALQQCLNKRKNSHPSYSCPLTYVISTNDNRIKSFELLYKKISDFSSFFTE